MSREKRFIPTHEILADAVLAGIELNQPIQKTKFRSMRKAFESGLDGFRPGHRLLAAKWFGDLNFRIECLFEELCFDLRIGHGVGKILVPERAIPKFDFS